MDCKQFRKHHLAYLDDTLPGAMMAMAQRHVLQCDGCAAHDLLVRRSLMVARSLPTLSPSADFQQKLRARLAQCRAEQGDPLAPGRRSALGLAESRGAAPAAGAGRPARAVVAVAASAVLGLLAYQALQHAAAGARSMQPVIAARPMPAMEAGLGGAGGAGPMMPSLTPPMVPAMRTGNPMWPATLMVDDAPMPAQGGGFSTVSAMR